ncbi:MAG: 4Fe-4S binding protein [Phyllobacteriaceae bacterium]|nr:4Fe-4S binding protein [Phyllobacteriaceae bacterium]
MVMMIAAIVGRLAPVAVAGELAREELAQRLSPPFVLGERDAELPVWPVFRSEGGTDKLAGYLFESADLAPIPGFSGTPPNLLIQLDADGRFRRVSVVSQHEPVFVDGLGPEPLDRFVEQYVGKSLAQNVKVGPPRAGTRPRSGANAEIEGVAKATASVRIVNESVLAAALVVVRAKLGLVAAARGPAARVRDDLVEPATFAELERDGLVAHRRFTERDVEAAFAGTPGAGLDPAARATPDAVHADLRVALLNVPTVGVNLLGEARWRHLLERRPGSHLLFVSMGGRARPFDEGWVHGATPDAFSLTQDGLALDLKDVVFEAEPVLVDAPKDPFVVLEVFEGAGFDPARPFTLSYRVIREKGQIYPERIAADLKLDVTWPARFFERTEVREEATGWRSVWVDRRGDLAVLAGALGLLAVVLAGQPATMRRPRLVAGFRLAYLAFTLVVIGWIFQAQLSIVTLAGLVKAALVTHDLGFLLWDPPSLVLWGVVIVTAVIWGRGTFCGWLCPFGALQELVERIARPLRLPRLRVPEAVDRRLRGLKYVVLLGFLAVAVIAPGHAEQAAEVEPFKTAITLVFQRAWPAVAWVVVLLAANLFVYKAFCRWLCPLGAFVAILGRLRRFDWIARRVECGSPCRLCERRCRYGAIGRDGGVDYAECFQCMDCVVIHQDATTCVPLVLAGRQTTRTEKAA